MRFLRAVMVAAALFFALVAGTYGPDALMVQYGRYHAQSWGLWQVRNLDEEALRSHDGGRVAWLIGSSVLRDAFDADAINEALAAQNSSWRVAKIGMDRGVSGLSFGLLERLPTRAGDMVVHSLSPDNFRKDWIASVGFPLERLMMMRSMRDIWQIEELSVQDKLEMSAIFPRDFVRYHEEYMRGLTAWLRGLRKWKKPRKSRPGYHALFRKTVEQPQIHRTRNRPKFSYHYFPDGTQDFSPTQFNIDGIARMIAHCAAEELSLKLIVLPHRREYATLFLEPGVRASWQDWLAQHPDIEVFPQPPEEEYFYDFKHTNSRGRAFLSARLIALLEAMEPQ